MKTLVDKTFTSNQSYNSFYSIKLASPFDRYVKCNQPMPQKHPSFTIAIVSQSFPSCLIFDDIFEYFEPLSKPLSQRASAPFLEESTTNKFVKLLLCHAMQIYAMSRTTLICLNIQLAIHPSWPSNHPSMICKSKRSTNIFKISSWMPKLRCKSF